jgi:hypothetical protein
MAHATDLITARNADILTIRAMLEEQRARRLDLVVSPDMIYSSGGRIIVQAGEATQLITGSGVVSAAGVYLPTDVGDEGLGQMLKIDGGFLKRLREEESWHLFDACVNGRLHGTIDRENGLPAEYAPYDGNLLLRLLKGDDEVDGVLRAILSPRFRVDMDCLDILTAVMEGFAEAGVDFKPDICNLSSRKMDVRFVMPQIAAIAPNLLRGYHSQLADEGNPGGVRRAGELGQDPDAGGEVLPGRAGGMRMRVNQRWAGWTVPEALRAAALEGKGYPPGQEPVVCAGLRLTCSDVGDGARVLVPEIRVRVCKNGLTLDIAADRQTHLGKTKQAGVIAVSAETDAAELALMREQAKDAVRTFTDQGWFEEQVATVEALAGVQVKKPEQVVKDVTRANGFSKAEADKVWEFALMGGANTEQATAGQVANAITAYSQVTENGNRAAELDKAALPVMRHLARIAG